MALLTIPVHLEEKLALADGSTEGGCLVSEALSFDRAEVANLYSIKAGVLKFAFQEHGVAYNESSATDFLVQATVKLDSPEGGGNFSYSVDRTPVEVWGLNFAGRVLVKHQGGEERAIYLPGTRTYDPAGLTGKSKVDQRAKGFVV